MSKGWYPVIDYEQCVGCLACNDMCRHGVYKPDSKTGKPKVVYGMGCVHGCHGYHYETYRPELQCEGKPRVAFICGHNSCRSQIAEALGKRLASDVFESYSAGTELKSHINPDAVRLMKQVYGIDMEQTQYNKLISDIPEPDVVIFMGCNVSCPNVPSQYAENWGLDDPSGGTDEVFLETIRLIEENIIKLKEKLR